jgi:hypothetical protein
MPEGHMAARNNFSRWMLVGSKPELGWRPEPPNRGPRPDAKAPKLPPLRPSSGHPAARSFRRSGLAEVSDGHRKPSPVSHTYSARAEAAWCQNTVRRPSSAATRRPRATPLRTSLPVRRLGRSSGAPFERRSSLALLGDAEDACRSNPLLKDGPRAAPNSRVGGKAHQVATLSGGGPGAEEPPCVDCHVQPRTSLIQLGPLPLAKQAALVDTTLQATEALPRSVYPPNQASPSQPNGLGLSRKPIRPSQPIR